MLRVPIYSRHGHIPQQLSSEDTEQSSHSHQRDGRWYVWSVEKSIPVFTQYTSFCDKKMHSYLEQHHCSDPPLEDQNDPDVSMSVAENNHWGVALRAAFTLQHFSQDKDAFNHGMYWLWLVFALTVFVAYNIIVCWKIEREPQPRRFWNVDRGDYNTHTLVKWETFYFHNAFHYI